MPRKRSVRQRLLAGLVVLLAAVPALVAFDAGAVPPPAAAQTTPRPVFLVGDSVMAAMAGPARSTLTAAGFTPTVEGQGCRRLGTPGCTTPSITTPPVSVLDVLHANPTAVLGDVVVVAGYNDVPMTAGTFNVATFRSRVDAVLDRLDSAPRVVLLTLREVSDNHAAANRVLRAEVPTRPNLVLVDWAALSAGQSSWFQGATDVHLTGTGASAMAGIVRDTLLQGTPPRRGACGTVTGPVPTPSTASARGYWLLDSAGTVWPYGQAGSHGDLRTKGVGTPPASFQATPTGLGYWIVDQRGVVHAFGDAAIYGDMSTQRLNGPVRRIEATPQANGYWLVASDGGVFAFNVPFLGSMGGTPLNQPVISMTGTATGRGYWLVAGDGGVFAFGDALFQGSTGGQTLNAPVIAMAVAPDGSGYWLYARDGGVFSFGVPFLGSVPGLGLCETPTTVAMRPTATGRGYWVVTDTGRVFAFGDAIDLGGRPALAAGAKVIDMAVMR